MKRSRTHEPKPPRKPPRIRYRDFDIGEPNAPVNNQMVAGWMHKDYDPASPPAGPLPCGVANSIWEAMDAVDKLLDGTKHGARPEPEPVTRRGNERAKRHANDGEPHG